MSILEGWSHRVSEIPDRGFATERSATQSECAALAEALDVLAVRHLSFSYRIRRGAGHRYVVSGRLSAGVTQACIITLDPLESEITEDVDEAFWPATDIAALGQAAGEAEVLSAEAPLPIEDGRLDIGRLVYEVLATAIDPYPRRPDASLQEVAPPENQDDRSDNPFAVLSRLRAGAEDKSGNGE